MAFADVAQLCGTNDSTSSTTWVLGSGVLGAWSAGNLLVLAIACDNVATTDGESSLVSSVVVRNSGGTTIDTFEKAVEYTNGSPGAAAGATISIWFSKNPANGEPAGGDILITFASAVTKKAAIGEYYTRDTGKTVQVMSGTKATGEAKSITSGTVTNAVEALLIRGLAIEDNENAIDTATTNWTAVLDDGAFTTGGGAAANMSGGLEFRIMTGAGAGVTSNPGGTSSGDMASAIIAFEEIASGVHSLTAGSGSYSISGTANALVRSRILVSASGSYSISGTAAVLTKGNPLTAASGNYTITGTAAAFKRTYILAGASGSYTISGTAATLTVGATSTILTAGSGSYSITGTAASLLQGYKFAAASGAYSVTGAASALTRTRLLVAASGSYSVSGTAAAFLRPRYLAANTGSYSVSGTAAALLRARVLVAASGSYSITGTAAALSRGYSLAASSGSYAISGTAADFWYIWIPVSPVSASWGGISPTSGSWTPITPTIGSWS